MKSPDDVTRVTGLSTLGAIARLKDAAGTQRQLISWVQTKAPETEAYRTLRTNIQFSSVDKPIRTLLVTSSGPGEGKSTTAANLAVVMAQTGQKVILVDTDLRRPVIHKTFGVPNNVGITTALLAGQDVDLATYLQPTEIENLIGPNQRADPTQSVGVVGLTSDGARHRTAFAGGGSRDFRHAARACGDRCVGVGAAG